jgi:formylglycine-generating enzyme required for sulfatase activity
MGIYEVTQSQYAAIMDDAPPPVYNTPKGKQLPVICTWKNASDYCRLMSEKEGLEYRLPTEAEWEYACRAGTTTPFYTGETINPDQANYDSRKVYGNGQRLDQPILYKYFKVGSFPPNDFGLYDMHGNADEWCMDFWYEGIVIIAIVSKLTLRGLLPYMIVRVISGILYGGEREVLDLKSVVLRLVMVYLHGWGGVDLELY